MNVSGATSVVTWEDCIKLQDTVLIAELNAAEHGVVDVACIGRVAVAFIDDTAVHTSAVAVPGLKRNLRHRLASVGVDDLNIDYQRYTRVTISDVLTDELAGNPFVSSQCLLWQSWWVINSQ